MQSIRDTVKNFTGLFDDCLRHIQKMSIVESRNQMTQLNEKQLCLKFSDVCT